MKTPTQPILTICCSASFYKQAVEIKAQLEAEGYEVVVPKTALVMQERNDYDPAHYKTWFGNEDDYPVKAERMRTHFDEITRGNAILVLNYEKHGKANYIGPNVLMEMALAFYQRKPIFVINELPADTPFEEELKGMMPVILHGKLQDLPARFRPTTN
ncbi:MAG TPA: hypothetical protein VJP80_07975 [Candidatus Saccharimonadales bacterium]|nr:hypothetical protein [Candidatus Saccharimonadales bacterium]